MGLDVYVGPLTRYYTSNWETIIEQMIHEGSITVPESVISASTTSPGDKLSAIEVKTKRKILNPTKPDTVREKVEKWRRDISEMLSSYIDKPLNWVESNDGQYFTDKPTWTCYSSLVLWASYEEHPELAKPLKPAVDYTEDPAYKASKAREFQSFYPHLLEDTEMWLPGDYRLTFRGPDVTGDTIGIGFTASLLDDLSALNEKTWRASEALINRWLSDGADKEARLETQAQFAFAVFYHLSAEAVKNNLPIKLDY